MSNLYQRQGIWWARFKVAGTEYRFSLRTRVKQQAERRLKAERARVEDEALFGIAEPRSWQQAIVSWTEHAAGEVTERTRERYKSSFRTMRPYLDGKMLAEIDSDMLRDMVKARRKVVALATIKRDLTAMSSVLDHAIEEGWIEANPTLTFRARRKMRERREPIVLPLVESMAAVEAASPDRFRDAQQFARLSGMRQDEIFGLKHSQLDARGETITIRGKRNKVRVIPFTAELQAIVERQPQFIGQPWVFWQGAGQRWASPGSRFGDIKRRVARKAAQKKLPFTEYRFHDLRHLFAVEFLRDGRGSIYDLQRLLGHDSIKTTEGYLEYLTPEQATAAKHGVSHLGAQEQRFAGEKA